MHHLRDALAVVGAVLGSLFAIGLLAGLLRAARLRAAADQLEDLDRGPSAQGLRLPREERSDAQVTLTAAQLRLAADLLEHPDFGA